MTFNVYEGRHENQTVCNHYDGAGGHAQHGAVQPTRWQLWVQRRPRIERHSEDWRRRLGRKEPGESDGSEGGQQN